MKVKDFVKRLNEIGYNDDTEIVFNMNNTKEKTCKDFYCQLIYGIMTYNAIRVDIDRKYRVDIEQKSERYYITNFINEYFSGYYDEEETIPKLSCFKEEAILFGKKEYDKEIKKLHSLGYTRLR